MMACLAICCCATAICRRNIHADTLDWVMTAQQESRGKKRSISLSSVPAHSHKCSAHACDEGLFGTVLTTFFFLIRLCGTGIIFISVAVLR